MLVSLFNFPVCILSHIATYLISQIPDLIQLITVSSLNKMFICAN